MPIGALAALQNPFEYSPPGSIAAGTLLAPLRWYQFLPARRRPAIGGRAMVMVSQRKDGIGCKSVIAKRLGPNFQLCAFLIH